MSETTNFSVTISDADRQLIATAYKGFNARTIDAVLATMQPDVRWPRAWEGDFVQGYDQVRAYWTKQWSEINPRVEPVELRRLPDGRIEVLVQQTVRDLDGNVLFDGPVHHIYTIREGLIQQMEIPAATEAAN